MLDRLDGAVARTTGKRHVLIYLRNAMHDAVIEPFASRLAEDPRVAVRYLAESPSKEAHIDAATRRRHRWLSRRRAFMWRIELFISADPWAPPQLFRCRRRLNVFHGVAGKYNLDDPRHLPIGFHVYDRVAFVNADRMSRYLEARIVDSETAVLVGFPKADALVNGWHDGPAVRARLGLDPSRPTAIYAPTWSPASSLNVAGEAIVASLAASGWNVIVKPHDLSFDRTPKYSGGVDWRMRLKTVEAAGQIVICDDADPSPLLAASDVLVTDHSSIAFEFFLLDRPVVVFDAPDLPRVARINPERIALLRSAARVVAHAGDVGPAALEELGDRRLSTRRLAIAAALFHEPGTATGRALAVVYELLALPPAPQTGPAKHNLTTAATSGEP